MRTLNLTPQRPNTNSDRRLFFQLPNEYKESVLTLAKLQFEKERITQKSDYNAYKNEGWYQTTRSSTIFNNCNQIAATYNEAALKELNDEHPEMLEELKKLEKRETNSAQYNMVYQNKLRQRSFS